jgi:hypothetical protein
MNKIDELIRKYKQTSDPLNQLNILTNLNEEVKKLIIDTSKKIK